MGREGADLGYTCFNFINNITMMGDLDHLINLYQSCFKDSQVGRWSTKALQETLSQKSTYILLVYPENNKSSHPIGFAIIQVVLDEAELLSLRVDEDNISAISIYNRFGPVFTGKRNKYYNTGNGDKKDALLMKINIGEIN